MLEAYRHHVAERAALGIPPLPLSAQQTADVIELLKNPPQGEAEFLLDLLTHRVPAGVDDAAKVKASYLAAIALGSEQNPLISRERATELLGTMLGGYNVAPLVQLLDDASVGTIAANGLKKTLLVFDAFHDVLEKAKAGNANAQAVLQSWAEAEWFTSNPEVPQSLTVTVFKVPGETNTDDLSPAPDATTRPDIPMHAPAMLKNKRDDAPFTPEEDGKRGPIQQILDLKDKGHRSPTSATWSVPAPRASRPPTAFCGGPAMTFRTSRTSVPVACAGRQDRADLLQHHGRRRCAADRTGRVEDGARRRHRAAPVRRQGAEERRGDRRIPVKSDVLFDEVRAGGRIPLIIGRGLTGKAREALGLAPTDLFRLPVQPADTGKGFSLAQKMVGRACGLPEGRACARARTANRR